VISTANTSSAQTVTVGSNPVGVAILPDGSAAYVANQAGGTVSVVSLSGTPTVTDTISFAGSGCPNPSYLAVTPNGKSVYVTCSGGTQLLWKITVATNTAAASGIAIPTGGNTGNGGLHQVVVTPDGHTAYVASGNDVYPVTLSDNDVGPGIPVTDAWSLAMSPDGAYLLAGRSDNGCGCSTDTVESINVAQNTVSDTFSAGGYEHFSLAFVPVTVEATPIVEEVSPATGYTTGGTSVTVTGSGFSEATALDFGGVAASAVTINADTSITAISPPGPAGAVDVTVTTPGGTSTPNAADLFTYTVDQTIPNSEPCTPGCTTNTVSTPLDQTSVSVTGASGDSNPDATTNLLVNTATLSCGVSKTHDYDFATAVSTLSTTDFAPHQVLTVTETVGDEPSTVGVKVCYAAGTDGKGTLLRRCKSSMKAPCLESLTGQSGDTVVASFLSPANDPRFWTGGAAVDLKAFTPASGAPNSTVTIKGKNLTEVQAVVIGGAQAAISTKSTNSELIVTVPPTAVPAAGYITVTAASGDAISTKSFTVT
jgi:hypothetical protein